jgi:NitT/TauT family transport system ATP-binding protein
MVRAKLYIDLQDIQIKTRKTIISVTHDLREAACLGDRVVIFTHSPGRIHREMYQPARPREITDPK